MFGPLNQPILASGSLSKYTPDQLTVENEQQGSSSTPPCDSPLGDASKFSHSVLDSGSQEVRVFVKTVRTRSLLHNSDDDEDSAGCHTQGHSDNISLYNLNRTCRGWGVPVPRGYWTSLWMVRDCTGWCGAVFTWLLIALGEALALLVLLAPPLSAFSVVNVLLSLTGALLGTLSHLRAMLSDPGAVKQGNATNEYICSLGLRDGTTLYRCAKCNSIKPDRAHHCSVCRRCIRKMDHHCPWINNCVGESNQKFFILFTVYISFISWHGVAFSGYIIHQCLTTAFMEFSIYYTYSTSTYLILLTCIIVEGLIFGLFTAIMCFTQIVSICRDETSIEHLKKEVRYSRRSCWDNFRDVFGHKFSYQWFSPFHSAPTTTTQAVLFNNCYAL